MKGWWKIVNLYIRNVVPSKKKMGIKNFSNVGMKTFSFLQGLLFCQNLLTFPWKWVQRKAVMIRMGERAKSGRSSPWSLNVSHPGDPQWHNLGQECPHIIIMVTLISSAKNSNDYESTTDNTLVSKSPNDGSLSIRRGNISSGIEYPDSWPYWLGRKSFLFAGIDFVFVPHQSRLIAHASPTLSCRRDK